VKSAALHHALSGECCSRELDILHDVLVTSDVSIAKALMISEVAQIARHEMRMRDYLLGKWRVRTKQASAQAASAYKEAGTVKAVRATVDTVMKKWAGDVEERATSELSSIYRLARKAGWKKAKGKTKASLQYVVPNLSELDTPLAKAKKKIPEVSPKFDLLDENALEELTADQMLWIGIHYAKNVRDAVRIAVTPTMLEGMGRVEAGKFIAKALEEMLGKVSVPSGFIGTDAKYFEGLAANTTTNARVRGQIRSFSDIGITAYEIVNPMDERTSDICQYMNGKVFQVSDAEAQIAKTGAARSPAAVRAAHPWLSADEIQEIGDNGGTKALAEAGLALPPYHFRCRSTVDISLGSMDFDSLENE
jgi:SPP1 gp7 family putative phage head morphogenesis protein